MKILIAVDSFKGTLTSKEVAEIIKNNVSEDNSNIDILAIADGGEGTVDSLMYATNGTKKTVNVQNAFGKYTDSYYCLAYNNETAIVEVALSSGVGLYEKSELNPYITTTYGLGETIKDALDQGISKLVVGIGGSSTNDAGSGMMQALGAKFYDAEGQLIDVMNGTSIALVDRIDLSGLDSRLNDVYIEVGCDVTNPLLGKNGCAEIYSRQKGATNEMVQVLEENMKIYADVVERTIGKDNKFVDGVGAAGGLGFGLLSLLNADLMSGLDVIADATKLEERIQAADMIVTGEGSFDGQSLNGKAPIKIAELGKKHQKRVVGVFALSSIKEMPQLFDEIYAIVPTVCTKQESLENPEECLAKLIRKVD